MKKLMSFALAAALFAVSCSQFEIDQTEVIPANDAIFYLGASIDNTKTVLGDKDGSTYPIEWQAGDKIYVNGTASNALTADQITDATCASFGFATELTEPYNAIYPASAVVAENTVAIPAAQAYVEGSYDPAAAIMVGTGSDPVDFACAVAFLKIKTTGAADAMIARAEVVALGGERLSGEFTTDYAALSSYADGKGSNAVAVVCATPVAAGTDIIVAIPAQTYASGIAITLQDAEGKAMFKKSTASFTAAAGKMYATELEYAPVALEGTITVDGTFTDWDSVPAVTYSLAPGTKSPVYLFKKMKLTADNDFVYMYVEVDESFPNFATFMDIFVDNDGNTATGGKLGSIEGYSGIPYTDSGLEWYIEGGCYDGGNYVDWFQKYRYDGTDGDGIFSKLTNVTDTFTSDQFAVSGSTDGKKTGRFEIKMDRKAFGFTGTKANFGIKDILGDPVVAGGLLPQGASDGSDFTRIAMAPIAMKAISEEPANAISFSTAPENAAAISIDHSKGLYDEALALAWSADILGASYTVNMSLAEDMTSPIAIYSGTSASLKLDTRTLNNIMYKLGKAYTKDVVVYYQVVADGNAVAPSAVKNVKISTEFSSLDDPRDGEFYTVTKVNGVEWLAENLRATKYSDGSAMPTGEVDLACFFYEAGAYGKKAGAYYGYGNAMGCHYNTASTRNGNLVTAEEKVQGVCPSGWHVPNQNDWMNLMNTAFTLAGATLSANFFTNATGAYARGAFQKMVLRADVEDYFASTVAEATRAGYTNDLGMYFLPVGRYDRANAANGGTVEPTGYTVSFASWNSTMNGGIWKAYSPFIKFGDGQYYTINQNIHWTYGAAETLRCVKD